MATAINCTNEVRHVRLRGRNPTVVGPNETRWPPRVVAFPVREPVTVSEADAEVIVERWGRGGIVVLQADESIEDGILRGLKIRYDALLRVLTAYRETQAARKAGGLEVMLPREHHRKALAEMNAIHAEMLERDPVLKASLPAVKPETVPDPVARELAAFGITPEAAPMVPGVEPGLLGIGV